LTVRDPLVGVAVLGGQGVEALSLLEGVEILSLEILDEGDLERLLVVDGDLDAGDL
jgi:hypothetical protein